MLSATSGHLALRWKGRRSLIFLKLLPLLISSKYPIDSNTVWQSFNWYAMVRNPLRSLDFIGCPLVAWLMWAVAITKAKTTKTISEHFLYGLVPRRRFQSDTTLDGCLSMAITILKWKCQPFTLIRRILLNFVFKSNETPKFEGGCHRTNRDRV